jgi:hypothetical protein
MILTARGRRVVAAAYWLAGLATAGLLAVILPTLAALLPGN